MRFIAEFLTDSLIHVVFMHSIGAIADDSQHPYSMEVEHVNPNAGDRYEMRWLNTSGTITDTVEAGATRSVRLQDRSVARTGVYISYPLQ